jgi:hypothetical protein
VGAPVPAAGLLILVGVLQVTGEWTLIPGTRT